MKSLSSPLVTIIVSCYNHESFVEECLNSIFNQTYKNFELIVIDDGSKDNSVSIIERLQQKNEFNFIKQSNKGLTHNVNVSHYKLAKGKYIVRIDSDDFMASDRIEKQVSFLEQNKNCELVFSKFHCVNERSEIIKKPISYIRTNNTFDDIFSRRLNVHICTIMHTKSLFDKLYPIPGDILAPDLYLKLKATSLTDFGFIEEYLSYYRIHEHNHSHPRTSLELIESSKKTIKYVTDNKNKSIIEKYLPTLSARNFQRLAIYNKKEAIQYLFPALKKPFDINILRGLIKLFTPATLYNFLLKRF